MIRWGLGQGGSGGFGGQGRLGRLLPCPNFTPSSPNKQCLKVIGCGLFLPVLKVASSQKSLFTTVPIKGILRFFSKKATQIGLLRLLLLTGILWIKTSLGKTTKIWFLFFPSFFFFWSSNNHGTVQSLLFSQASKCEKPVQSSRKSEH